MTTVIFILLLIPVLALSPWTLSMGLIAFCGVFVAFEFALVKTPLRELERDEEKKIKGADLVLKLKRDLNALLAACQFGITLTSLGLTLALEPAIHHLLTEYTSFASDAASTALAMSIGAFFHVTFGELIPKGLALVVPRQVLYLLSPFMQLFRWLAVPFIKTCNAIANYAVRGMTGKDPDTDAHEEETVEIDEALMAAHTQGQIAPRQLQIMRNVLDFSERTAREVMTPARVVVCLDLSRSWEENLNLAEEHGYSRFPVIDRNPHEVVGYVRRAEMLKSELGGRRDLQAILHHIERRPESAPLALLNLFKGTPLVACYDEHDSFSGLLTAEDVIEQIVGEIYDETDDIDVTGIQSGNDGTFRVEGSTLVEVAARALEIDEDELPQDVDTVGGLILKQLARQPARGDRVEIGRWLATVESAQGFRIQSLTFRPIAPRNPDGSRPEGTEPSPPPESA
ncbi:MAG: HlyC/CorC family transporter [Myxococcales bacterium]|nr:HlyC/CorC family transporter [Myxococcales bacterium]